MFPSQFHKTDSLPQAHAVTNSERKHGDGPFLAASLKLADIHSDITLAERHWKLIQDELTNEKYKGHLEKMPLNPKTRETKPLDQPFVHTLITTDGKKNNTAPVPFLSGNKITTPSFSSKPNACHFAIQGPLSNPNTIADTFNALLENDSYIIVALVMHKETKIVPGKPPEEREKCADYWTLDQERDLGHGYKLSKSTIVKSITYPSQNRLPQGYDIRELDITLDGKHFRKITMFHYLNWPDQGIPYADILFQFNKEIQTQIDKNCLDGKEGPVTSHCSAGCGRTGVYLAIRFIQEYIDFQRKSGKQLSEIEINIPQLVLEMNLCRRLINSSEQYNVLLDWTERYVQTLLP